MFPFLSTSGDSYCTINSNHIALPNGSVVKLRTNADGDRYDEHPSGQPAEVSVPAATLYINGSQVAQGVIRGL